MTQAETSGAQAHAAGKADKKITIEVVYNGVSQHIETQPNQAVQALLQHALNAFGVHDQRDTFALFRQDGTEVAPASMSVAEANLAEGTLLALRPRVVRGGR